MARCESRVLALDDRMGGFTHRCDSANGHDGPHRHIMGATEPAAALIWTGDYRDNESSVTPDLYSELPAQEQGT